MLVVFRKFEVEFSGCQGLGKVLMHLVGDVFQFLPEFLSFQFRFLEAASKRSFL